MRIYNKIFLVFSIAAFMISCADNNRLEYSVEKPESIAVAEYLNNYDVLKSYVNRTENPNFKLGAGADISGYTSKGLVYQLLNSNFDEITMGYGMKHGAVVQNDGSLKLDNVQNLIKIAREAGTTIYGHTLCWHANQNAKYLNSIIAPTVIPGQSGPTWDLITSQDFETNDASNYMYNNNAVASFTAVGEGSGGKGRAIKISNSVVRTNDYDCQFFIKFSPAMQLGEKYQFSIDVRSDVDTKFGTQAHVVPYQYKFWNLFGDITTTTQWTTFTKEITVTSDLVTTGAIAFNLGKTATSFYFDNITLKKYNEKGGSVPVDGGYAMVLTNPQTQNPWDAQVGTNFSALTNGKKYNVSFMGKADNDATLTASLQTPAGSYPENSFGSFSLTTGWTEVKMSVTVTSADRTRFLINFGNYVGTIYIDNVKLVEDGTTTNLIGNGDFETGAVSGWNGAWNGIAKIAISPLGKGFGGMGSGDIIIPKTDAEKKTIIDNALETWISGMLDATKDYVKAWDVVNEPMSDWPDPTELKTGVGKTLATDEFYWQDYLGKDYAVRAIQIARKYGNADDKLFINDYGLEGTDQKKCLGLIDYIKYVESKGVKVDGIGTQMHVTYGVTTIEGIIAMFKNLAATGKLIKISELDMGVRPSGNNTNLKTEQVTLEQSKAMAQFYQDIIKAYFDNVPAAQRYGITQWAVTDSPASSSWRSGEPVGLWTTSYGRKHTYGGFANGLAGKVLFTPSN
ncbi:MAG: endo-1,4-beta-xylanase [Paludibacteraceae bacterium]